jgi:hypothetical protein
MPTDLTFDATNREMPLTADGDFIINTNPSVQNGIIILKGRVINLVKPQLGIGFNSQVLGSDVSEATFQLNRCVVQIQSDGGNAAWRPIAPPPGKQFDFSLDVNYQK